MREGLTSRDKVVVKVEFAPWDYRDETPCWVVRVDEESLTCSPVGKRRQRIVYPARAGVYGLSGQDAADGMELGAHRSSCRGGFLIGCAITDDECDYPLGAMGAVAGGLLGAEHMSTMVFVYRRIEPLADEAVSP